MVDYVFVQRMVVMSLFCFIVRVVMRKLFNILEWWVVVDVRVERVVVTSFRGFYTVI